MAQGIRSAFWVSFGLYLLCSAYLRHLHPSTDPFAINGLENVLSAAAGALLIYGSYDAYRRRHQPTRATPNAIAPLSAMCMWLLAAAPLIFGIFWPLVWRFSFDVPVRCVMLAYLLFEARAAFLRKDQPPEVLDPSSNSETTGSGIGLKIVAAIVIAFGVAVVIAGLWYVKSERSKVIEWPRTTAILVDKKISPVGARLIFEYEVTGGRSAGRADRWGREEEMRGFLEPYRTGNIYPIGYNPQDVAEVEFHLGYNSDLFRLPIAIVIFGTLFAAAGVALGTPWKEVPGR